MLLKSWPAGPVREAELLQLAKAEPSFRSYVFHAGSDPAPDGWQQTLPHAEFLPDAMVVEGEWQQEKDLRHQIEVSRSELGTKLSTEVFLQQARYALFLRTSVRRDGVRHVHAASASELVAVWVLRRLCGVTISATIEDKPPLHDDVLVSLAKACTGIRTGSSELANKIRAIGAGAPRVEPAKGRGFDPNWMARLREWSAS